MEMKQAIWKQDRTGILFSGAMAITIVHKSGGAEKEREHLRCQNFSVLGHRENPIKQTEDSDRKISEIWKTAEGKTTERLKTDETVYRNLLSFPD